MCARVLAHLHLQLACKEASDREQQARELGKGGREVSHSGAACLAGSLNQADRPGSGCVKAKDKLEAWWWWWSDLWGFHHAVLTHVVASCLCVHVCV